MFSLLSLVLALPAGEPTPADVFSRDVRQATLHATVQIVNPMQRAAGSGVILKNDDGTIYIVTARHVVVPGDNLEVQFYTPQSHPKADSVSRSVKVIAVGKGSSDLAILRVFTEKKVPGALRLCPADKLPTEKNFPVLSSGCDAESAPSLLEGRAARKSILLPGEKEPVSLWEVEEGQQFGRSGGPLVDRRGWVIGICSGKGDGRGYFCTVDQVYAILKANGLRDLADN